MGAIKAALESVSLRAQLVVLIAQKRNPARLGLGRAARDQGLGLGTKGPRARASAIARATRRKPQLACASPGACPRRFFALDRNGRVLPEQNGAPRPGTVVDAPEVC